jgi:hypothetical protein
MPLQVISSQVKFATHRLHVLPLRVAPLPNAGKEVAIHAPRLAERNLKIDARHAAKVMKAVDFWAMKIFGDETMRQKPVFLFFTNDF